MSKAPELRELPDLPDEIIQAGLNSELVLFVGSGISMLLGLPSWSSLAAKGLQDLQTQQLLNYSDLEQLRNLEPKKQLSIAKLIAEESEYDLDLTKFFKGPEEGNSIYKLINDIGCACVTTNYDELLAPRFQEDKPDPVKPGHGERKPVTPQPVKRIYEKNNLFAKHLNEPGTVVHLHGSISKQEEMVVTTKQYLQHYDDPNVQHFLGELFAKKIVLFMGYGLEEAEILEHILRRGAVGNTKDRRRFVLQGYFKSQEPLYRKLHQYYVSSFGVHVIGFIRDYEDYKQQEAIIKAWGTQIKVKKPPLAVDFERMNEVLSSG